MSLILGIESSCDETAASVVRDGRAVLSNAIASQHDLHAKFGGVVPEIASRAHIERILPIIDEALESAQTGLNDIDAIAVGNRPGLIGSLLVGVASAKALAWALGKPLIGVDHVRAHLYAAALDAEPIDYPALGLVVSGGHTSLYRVDGPLDMALLGRTIDDAVGEAYDKVAAILKLGFPGGPIVDRCAQRGNGTAVRFPRTLLDADSLDFSFSGLKTAVLYEVCGKPTGRGATPRSSATLHP
jgi:N6-L-threonylcarbamoyladenine synthase